jgi:hypothetical protein
LRSNKRILNKIKSWSGNPMLVAGMYRLFTYVAWEDIPEEYKEFFDEKAKEVWNKDLGAFTEENIELDIDAEIKAILKVLVKKNVTHSLGMIPIILADAYVYGIGTGPLEGKLLRIITQYKEFVDIDRDLAEQYTILSTVEFLKEVITKVNRELSFNIEDVTEKLMAEYDAVLKKQQRQNKLSLAAEKALSMVKK